MYFPTAHVQYKALLHTEHRILSEALAAKINRPSVAYSVIQRSISTYEYDNQA